jgi:sialidase-1
LIAFGEARRYNCLDWTYTDLVYKISTDSGVTWGPLHVLYSNSSGPQDMVWIGNAAPVIDRSTNRLFVPFCRNNMQVLLTYTDDGGETWSAPRNLTGTHFIK